MQRLSVTTKVWVCIGQDELANKAEVRAIFSWDVTSPTNEQKASHTDGPAIDNLIGIAYESNQGT
jgi:hypothetical protein